MTAVPVMPTDIAAGGVVTATDLNAVSAVASFLLNKPLAVVQATATQALTGGSLNFINFAKVVDTDGMFNAGVPDLLIIQTQGYYKVSYCIQVNAQNSSSYVQVYSNGAGPTPAGTTYNCWPGGAGRILAGNNNCVHASGVIPTCLYPNDLIYPVIVPVSNCTAQVTDVPSTFSLEFVSA